MEILQVDWASYESGETFAHFLELASSSPSHSVGNTTPTIKGMVKGAMDLCRCAIGEMAQLKSTLVKTTITNKGLVAKASHFLGMVPPLSFLRCGPISPSSLSKGKHPTKEVEGSCFARGNLLKCLFSK